MPTLGTYQPSNLRTLSEVEAAWFGAVLDTDGCINLLSSTQWRITVGAVDLELISGLLRVTGTGTIQYYNCPGKQEFWVWTAAKQAEVPALLQRCQLYSRKAGEWCQRHHL